MMKITRSILFALSTIASVTTASERSRVDELVAAMKGRTLSEAELGVQLCNDPVNSCSGVTFDEGDTMRGKLGSESPFRPARTSRA